MERVNVCNEQKKLKENKVKKGCKIGCMSTFIVFFTILCLFFIVLSRDVEPEELTIEEVQFSTTEQLRALSGMNFLKEITFVNAIKSDGATKVTFEWCEPLTKKEEQQILSFAKKSQYPELWTYEDSIVEQKFYCEKLDLSFYITYEKDKVYLTYGTPNMPFGVELILDSVHLSEYKLIWYDHFGFMDHSVDMILQFNELSDSFFEELKSKGYLTESESKYNIEMCKSIKSSDGYLQEETCLRIDRKRNVVEIEWNQY